MGGWMESAADALPIPIVVVVVVSWLAVQR